MKNPTKQPAKPKTKKVLVNRRPMASAPRGEAMGVKMKPTISIEIVSGVEGLCLVLGDTRVAGPKPWGGGSTIRAFVVDVDRLMDAIPREVICAYYVAKVKPRGKAK